MKARHLLPVMLAAVWFALVPALAVAGPKRDSDRDGLPDKWETKPKKKKNGKRKKPAGPLKNLVKLGAKPKHRDVFVEVNFAQGLDRSAVSCGELDALVEVFASAPLENPDGTTGIRLHIDAGIDCASGGYDFGGSSTFTPTQPCANPSDIASSMAAKRFEVFHIAGVVEADSLCGAEGFATSTDFMLNASSGGLFGHVFMHELGHVFGLDHGGLSSFSVMSRPLYSYPGQYLLLDYNRYPIEALNENALSEPAGIQSTPAGEAYLHRFYSYYYCPSETPGQPGGFSGYGPADANIDWDCEGAPFYMPPEEQYIDQGLVSADINGDGVKNVIPAVPAEWPLLRLDNGRIGGD